MTRVFTETPEQSARLEKLNSSYVCGLHVKDNVRQCSVTLVDAVSGQQYHTGYHPESYSMALDMALNTISARPKTTAEMAAEAMTLSDENARLRQLVEQLKSRESEPAPAQEEPAAAQAAPTRRRASAT